MPGLAAIPIIYVLADLILGIAVTLLNLAFELVSATADDVEIVVREFAPLLFDLPLNLLPISFNLVPVHHSSPQLVIATNCGRSHWVPLPEFHGAPFSEMEDVLLGGSPAMKVGVLASGNRRPPLSQSDL